MRRAIGALAAAVIFAPAADPATASARRRSPIVEAVEAVLPAVVNIGTEELVRVVPADPLQQFRGELFDRLFGDFFRQPPSPGYQVRHSLGSGVIVDSLGFILTNFHVIERATTVRVTLVDGRTFPAQLIAGDELSDLALIRIDAPEPLPEVRFARDGDVMLGEPAIAVGHPFGLSHTVTVGVISSRNREARYRGQVIFRDILQTDAAVNPGSSGGPLLNADGELMGINVAIHQEGQNIGFAVPVHRARALLTQWLSPRLLRHLSVRLDLEERDGRLLVAAGDGPPAPLRAGDRIGGINGRAVASLLDYHRLLLRVRPGDRLRIAAERDGRPVLAEVEVGPYEFPDGVRLAMARLGLVLEPPAAEDPVRGGLRISGVREGGPAARAGLRPGLRVTRIGGRAVGRLEEVGATLETVRPGDTVALSVAAVERAEGLIVARTHTLAVVAE